MNQRTVVAWDRSDESRSAVAWALERAGHGGEDNELVLVHVVNEVSLVPGKTFSPREFDEAAQAVRDEADRVGRQAPAVRVTGQIIIGDALNALRRYTDPTTLVVVGTQPRTYPRFRFSWSLGTRLAASALGPVAIIPSRVEGSRSGVVAGVDGSEASVRAALFAAVEARRRGIALHLVHAWLEPPLWQEEYEFDAGILEDLDDQHAALVRDAADLVRRSYPDVELTAETVHGRVVPSLLGCSPLPELVVVGAQSRGALNRFMLGSATHELVLNLDVPVVIVGDRVRERTAGPGDSDDPTVGGMTP